ncbi:MAG: hypothetical protein AB7I48_04920, partial [Planctomycetaceae bacterium]
MKFTVTMAALFTLFVAGAARAEDGHVPQSTLASLGLGDMQVLSDNDGMAVRGMSGATAWGTSVVTGLLLDPDTKSFVIGTDANMSGSSSSAYSKHGSFAYQDNHSYVELALVVSTSTSNFTGLLIGGAGGNSAASG